VQGVLVGVRLAAAGGEGVGEAHAAVVVGAVSAGFGVSARHIGC